MRSPSDIAGSSEATLLTDICSSNRSDTHISVISAPVFYPQSAHSWDWLLVKTLLAASDVRCVCAAAGVIIVSALDHGGRLLWCGLWYAGSRKLAFRSRTRSPAAEKAPPHALLCQCLRDKKTNKKKKHSVSDTCQRKQEMLTFTFLPVVLLTTQVSTVNSKMQRCKRFGRYYFSTCGNKKKKQINNLPVIQINMKESISHCYFNHKKEGLDVFYIK